MSGTEDELTPHEFAKQVFAELEGDADTAEAPAEEQVVDDGTDTGEESRPPVEDATGRLHGEDGKFVPKSGSKEDTEEDADPSDPVSEEGSEGDTDEDATDADFVIEVDDDETAERVQGVLEKYDGDVSKALVALTEAQSLIGRKGNEAAQANAELESLRSELVSLKQGQDAMMSRLSQPIVPITQDLIESDPAGAAQQAVMQDNVQALEVAIRAWSEGTDYVDANPQAAQLFLEKLALQAQFESQQEPATQAEPLQSELDAEVQKVVDRHPDLDQYLSAIAVASNDNPILKRAMETGTPVERAQALEALTVIAKSRQGADTSHAALQRVQIRVKTEADDARAKARVVSASRSSAAVAGQPTGVDQFLEAFDARLGLNVDEG